MDTTPPPSLPTLRRRNSIATSNVVIPTKLTVPTKPLHTFSLPPFHTNGASAVMDFELVSLNSASSLSYTSLKDLLPSSAVNSPTSGGAGGGGGSSAYEICIRNRLVKQAAWAYLQPMASSPAYSSGSHFLRRIWVRFSTIRTHISACFRFLSLCVIPSIAGAFDRILQAIRVHLNT